MDATDFAVLSNLFREYFATEDEISYNPWNPGNGIIVGCDCGCGGDVIDWDLAKQEWDALGKELREQQDAIMEYLNG